MVDILELRGGALAGETARATEVLEAGGLVLLPERPFELSGDERRLLDPTVLAKSKNVSFDPSTGGVSGLNADAAAAKDVGAEGARAMLRRFSERAEALLNELAPAYCGHLQMRRTSFRPGEVAERVLSRRKDDRRLHVDAFPANPTQGRRILRVFANVNPSGESRLWDVGEEAFEPFARRFASGLRRLGGGWLGERLGLTRGRRTPYDTAMLHLHDRAKLDDAYQASALKRRVAFPSGSMWAVYTDSVLHAALAGQHAFEQTFLLPVEAMQRPQCSPVRILERLTGRPLL